MKFSLGNIDFVSLSFHIDRTKSAKDLAIEGGLEILDDKALDHCSSSLQKGDQVELILASAAKEMTCEEFEAEVELHGFRHGEGYDLLALWANRKELRRDLPEYMDKWVDFPEQKEGIPILCGVSVGFFIRALGSNWSEKGVLVYPEIGTYDYNSDPHDQHVVLTLMGNEGELPCGIEEPYSKAFWLVVRK